MRPGTPFPHPLISFYVFLLAWLFSLPFNSYAQAQHLSRKAQRHAYIDSIYHAAQAKHLDTDAPLRYDFWFVDREQGTLTEFSKRLARDSFELESVKLAGKKWKLNLFINAAIPEATMYDLDKKLRRLRYDYLVDEYLGFSIQPRDLAPLSIPVDQFIPWLNGLENEPLYWAGKRLLKLKSFDKALTALTTLWRRQYKPDTVAFLIGQALVATNTFNDAIDYWNKSLEINPNYFEVHFSLGELLYDNAYFAEALGHFQKADLLDPHNDKVKWHMAECLYHLQRYNASYTLAKEAVKLNRKNVFAKSLLKLLNEPDIKRLRKKFPDQ